MTSEFASLSEQLAKKRLSSDISDETGSLSEMKYPIKESDIYVENDKVKKSEIQHSHEFNPACRIQSVTDKMDSYDEEKVNQLYPVVQLLDKKGCLENQSSVELDNPYDLLTKHKPSLENYQPQPVRRKIYHELDNHEADLSIGENNQNQMSDSYIQQLRKATSESENCWSSTDLTDPSSFSTTDGLLQQDRQQVRSTFLHAGDTTATGLCMVQTLPSLSNSSDSSMEVCKQKDDDLPADSSDLVVSPTKDNLPQMEYEHDQRLLLKGVDNFDKVLNDTDGAVESSEQTKSQCKSNPVSSHFNEDLVHSECQHTKKALLSNDGKMKTNLCKSVKVETPFPCRIIFHKKSSDEKEESQPFSCEDGSVDSGDPFDLSTDQLTQVESQHVKHTALNSADNTRRTLTTSCHLLSQDISNCKKEDNENSELHSQKPCGLINLSPLNDYESVKMKLLQLKQTFDKAMGNIETDKQPLSMADGRSDGEIKLTQGNELSSKTDDPFDLSSEDDLHPEKYRPLKRKLCTDSKTCGKNSNADNERAKKCGTADMDSQAAAAEAISLKTLEIKKPKTAYRVAYVHSQQLLEKANELIRIKGRAELVHSLISSFGLLQYLQVVSPRCATETEILGFHCPDYISFLRDSGDVPDSEDTHDGDAESYGLTYDCPLQNRIYETCSLISGATIVAAETLMNNAADVAINWYGGWHHAKRDSAAGFCYINDIVLGILKLREKFDRILYVDIDLHHGDGVEEAFSMTPKVMTVSFHKYMFGFFPGTGSMADVGTGKGKHYSVNVPLLDGIRDAEFCAVFYSIMKLVREKFQPQVIVLQCGADTLSSDPMTSFNLTHLGISRCVGLMLSWNLPTMLLGGGGYNFPSTAKCWSFLTSLAAGKKLPLDIPEHEHLLAYGPDFEMSTTAGNRKDCNTKQYLANLVATISRNLSNI